MTESFDEKVLHCFLKKQLQLFPEEVASTVEEAADFLEDSMAVVANSEQEVMEYYEEEGIDLDGVSEIGDIQEVFDIGDGRFLIVP